MVDSSSQRVVIGLGTSLGRRRAQLELAVRLLHLQPGVVVLATSKLYRTPPWGGVARNPFLNAAVLARTTLTPEALLACCQYIERRLGRHGGLRWGDRALDLDLLWMESTVVERPGVRVPHPRIADRSFVVRPLEDVLPGAVDPVTGRSFLERHLALGPAAMLPRPASVGVLSRPRGSKGDS